MYFPFGKPKFRHFQVFDGNIDCATRVYICNLWDEVFALAHANPELE